MSGRTIVFALAAALLGGCSTGLLYYPKVNEQVISLSKGDLEAAGIAFMTPSTVTGQEQEKEAVALTFTDILKAERPGLKVIPLAGTLGAVNKAGLSETYRRMKPPLLKELARTIPFAELPKVFDDFIGAKVTGRIVVDLSD